MRIEFLSAKPDRAGRYQLRFDNGETMRLYRQTVEDFGLYAGLELSDEQIEHLTESAGQTSAKMRAVRIVAASSVSRRDLEQRLVRKGQTKEQAKAAVEWMEDLKLLDDRETARQIVARSAAHGYGIARAKQMLYEKQIPKDLWSDVLEDYPDQTENILAFLRARLGESPDQREIKRAMDALMRRGHSWSDVRRALNEMSICSGSLLEE